MKVGELVIWNRESRGRYGYVTPGPPPSAHKPTFPQRAVMNRLLHVEVLAQTALNMKRGRAPRHLVVEGLQTSLPECSLEDISCALERATRLRLVRVVDDHIEIVGNQS